MAQSVKNLPATWETWVRALGWEDPLEEGMATRSLLWISLVAQMVKNPPATQETWVPSLGWEHPWRMEQPPRPVFWPREFHGRRSLASYCPCGCKDRIQLTDTFHFFHFILSLPLPKPLSHYDCQVSVVPSNMELFFLL